MPQLFGSSYYFLAVVVVLVLAIAGLILMQRRQKGSSTTKADKVKTAKKAPAAKSTRESRKAAALAAKAAEATAIEEAATLGQAEGMAGEATEVAAAPVAADAPRESPAEPDLAMAAENEPPAPETPAAPSGGRFGLGKHAQQETPSGPPLVAVSADPLQTIIASILQGWGDLTTEDTNRLALFRKDKVVAALAGIELPKDLKSNEYAKTRLTQLRRYASYIEQGEPPTPADVTEHEFAGMAFGAPVAAAAAPTVAASIAPQGGPGTPAIVQPMVPAATPVQATVNTQAATTPTAAPSPEVTAKPVAAEPAPAPVAPREPVMDPSHAFAVPKDATDSWDMPSKWTDVKVTPRTKEPWELDEDVTAGEERAAEFDWGSEESHVLPMSTEVKSADLAWATEPTLKAPADKPQQPAMVEPLGTFDPASWDKPAAVGEPASPPPPPSPAAPEAPNKPAWADADEAHRTAEAAVAAAAAAFWNLPEAPAMEQAASSTKGIEAHGDDRGKSRAASTQSPSCTSPFSGLGMKVSTAADIMALPLSERADMLAFLEPAELSKVFVLAADKDLKKSVIDTLEHIGNTCALDALRECLEDPDPEVQLYALEAADRMLGTAS